MKRFQQRNISFLMTALYLLLSLSPLASVSSRARPLFQAAAKECSGDCRLCGCSPERSASQTCCCWQKKLAEAKIRQQWAKPQSCPTAPADSARSCCSKPPQHADHGTNGSTSAQTDPQSGNELPTVSISICPCGSGKDLAFSGDERSQHIPYRFLSGVPAQPATQFVFLQPEQLASHSGEPPDPPPKIHILS